MARLNWNEVRRLYIYGGDSPSSVAKPNKATGKVHLPSYQEIANFYGVHIQTIAKRAKKENWREIRQFTQIELSEKTEKRLKELQIKSLTEVNAEHFKIGNLVIQRFLEQMQPCDKDGNPQKPQAIYAKDALGWAKLRQEISEKASDVDEVGNVNVTLSHEPLSKEDKGELYETLAKLRKLTKGE